VTKINYCGAIYEVSGYGEFARYFIYALNKAGADIGVEPIVISPQKLDYGKKSKVCERLLNKGGKAQINVINMIPPLFKRYKKSNAINVGFTMWEADRLPPIWTKLCNEMDAIMTPCKWNVEVFKNSGVTVPIYHVPAGIDREEIPEKKYHNSKTFRFYSIFQWLERKCPQGLVKAFMSEFTREDDVELVLKTYVRDKGQDNKRVLEQEIDRIRDEMKLKEKDHAPIRLITDLLSDKQMTELHQKSHCFVLPHRGEGWGMPHMSAMLHGRPVIATGYSGNMDFMNEDNSFLIDYQLTPCCNVGAFAPFYNGRMWWAEPNLAELASVMRYVYQNQEPALDLGKTGREHIIENFNDAGSSMAFMAAMAAIEDIVKQ
jgi:glycosyltransferase involved in cell wall biosynthesis